MLFGKKRPSEELGPFVLVNDHKGRRFLPVVRVNGGYVNGETLYPDEFLETLPGLGGEVVQLAESMAVPSDGNLTSENVDGREIVKLSQIGFMTDFTAFNRARKRLVWQSLYEAGDGSQGAMRLFTSAFVIMACLVVFWQSFGLKGKVSELAETNRTSVATMNALGKEMERLRGRPQAQVNVVDPAVNPASEPTVAPVAGVAPTALVPGAPGGLPAARPQRKLREGSPYATPTATRVQGEPGGVGSGPCKPLDVECLRLKEEQVVR